MKSTLQSMCWLAYWVASLFWIQGAINGNRLVAISAALAALALMAVLIGFKRSGQHNRPGQGLILIGQCLVIPGFLGTATIGWSPFWMRVTGLMLMAGGLILVLGMGAGYLFRQKQRR